MDKFTLYDDSKYENHAVNELPLDNPMNNDIKKAAKAYDEAIDRAKKELNACGSQDCDAARQIFRLFPELVESKDEKIRKTIISVLEQNIRAGFDHSNGFKFTEMITWLEKQELSQSEVTKISDKDTWNYFDEKIYHVLYREFSDRAVSPSYDANLYAEILCWADSVKKRLKRE